MELLVRVVDKPKSGNSLIDAGRTTAGDVIAVMPAGHIWGKEEIANPDWRIVRVPGLSHARAEALVSPEVRNAFEANHLLRKRQMHLDLSQLPELSEPRTATRNKPDAVISQSRIVSASALKSSLVDPRFIGPRRAVIG